MTQISALGTIRSRAGRRTVRMHPALAHRRRLTTLAPTARRGDHSQLYQNIPSRRVSGPAAVRLGPAASRPARLGQSKPARTTKRMSRPGISTRSLLIDTALAGRCWRGCGRRHRSRVATVGQGMDEKVGIDVVEAAVAVSATEMRRCAPACFHRKRRRTCRSSR